MMQTDTDLDDLIACPHCDALWRVGGDPGKGQRVLCGRCHTTLIAARSGSLSRAVGLALTAIILVGGAVFFPFLEVAVQGFRSEMSVIDAATTFWRDDVALLTVAVFLMIVALPLIRSALVIYAVLPMLFDRPVWPQAARAFRWAETLRPWSMAEIFTLSCAVALVKIISLANVGFGPAVWMFAAFVGVITLQDVSMCRRTIWRRLDASVSR